MPATFTRLLKYARSTKAEAVENFTTEALAAAINQDPRPFVALLARHGLVGADVDPHHVSAVSQKAVRTGWIDLAVVLPAARSTHEVWIEVKVDAGVHGDQIEVYQAGIAERGASRPTSLAFLSKWPFSSYASVPHISWREVRDAAARADAASLYWHDLAVYLKETGVADTFSDPIVAREAAAMTDAFVLLRKMRRLLRHTAERGEQRWPELGWPTKGRANSSVGEQFVNHGRLTLKVADRYRAQLYLGLVQEDLEMGFVEQEPHAMVWVESNPKATDVRRQLVEAAGAGGLSESWQRSYRGSWGLYRSERFGAFASLDQLADWWFARIEDLDAAGVLALLPRLGEPTAEDAIDAAEESADEDPALGR